jgi:hypothetical protein
MENITTVEELMEKNDYAITFDLKFAYNHIPVHKSQQPLLGIGWKGKCYRFLEMPFGLSDAPRVFSLIMRKVERRIVDSENMTIQLTKERYKTCLLTARKTRRKAYKTGLVTTRQLASVIGTLSSTRLQFPLASLYLEKLHRLKKEREGCDGMVYLELSIVGELSHWTRKIKSRIPRKIVKDIAPQSTIITDAAPSGWDATIVESSTGKILTQDLGK